MSILEEHTSMTLNEYQRPSSIAQRFYLNTTHLPSTQSASNSDSLNPDAIAPVTGEDAGSSSLVASQTELAPYESESGKNLANSGQPVPYFGQPVLNVSVPAMMNTLNSNFPNVLSTSSQAISTANPITTYYDLYASRSQNVAMQSMAYYPGQEYSKYPFLPGPSSVSVSCVQSYPTSHVDNTDQGPTGPQGAPSTRSMDQTHVPICSQPPINSTRLGFNSTGLDLNARYTDPLNRQGRFPVYQFGGSDDPLSSHPPAASNRLNGTGVELLVSNLDYNIGAKEWRKILYTQLQSTIKNVHSIVIQTQADGSNCAIIKVGSIEDARLAISHFHRKKIGYKRIQVNIVSPNGSFGTKGLKSEVVSLLRSVSSNALPVCKFIDLFEKRFHRSISVADLYKMRDVIEIKEQPGNQGGRLVTLSVRAHRFDGMEASPATDLAFCRRHCVEGSPEYLQAMDCAMLPSVQVSLGVFRQQVLKLLQDHGGSMPLLSFPACYKAEFGELKTVPLNPAQSASNSSETGAPAKSANPSGTESSTASTQPDSTDAQATTVSTITPSEPDPGSDRPTVPIADATNTNTVTGVPLEHLLTCVPSVRIHVEQNGVRKLVFEPGSDQFQGGPAVGNVVGSGQPELYYNKCQLNDPLSTLGQMSNPPGSIMNPGGPAANTPGVLLDQLHQFSREVVDLLKHQPGCQILLSKFIPSYHHHFGKQCRVADYGYSKLHELIDALPSVVHVMGSGHVRLLALSHRVQVRRFTNELIKVLKSQSTKSCRLADYAAIYRRIYRKDFRITDYGVCYLSDMLMEVSDSAVEVTQSGADTVISLPKRVQTMEERERTELFAIEVADLLCQSPRCRLPFNKFIPSYHHHFSRQCRVADYGFTKLIDLLEAVPNVVQIVEEHGEKYVTLVRHRHLRIVAEQLLTMLEAAPGKRIPLDDLLNVYMKHQGYALCLEDFQFTSVTELLSKLPRLVRIETVCVEKSSSGVPLASSDGDSANTVLPPTALPTEKESASLDEQKSNDPVSNVDPAVTHSDEVPGEPDTNTESKPAVNSVRPTVDYVCLADRAQIKHLAHKVLLVLLEAPSGTLSVAHFSERFRCTFRDEPNLNLIHAELGDIVEFKKQPPNPTGDSLLSTGGSSAWNNKSSAEPLLLLNPHTVSSGAAAPEPDAHLSANEALLSNRTTASVASAVSFSDSRTLLGAAPDWEAPSCVISLRPLILFARELRELLRQNQGKLLLVQLCAVYQRRFGVPLRPQRYNYPSLATLLQAVDFVAVMRGRGVRCTLVLCQDFLGKLSYRVAYNTKPVLDPANDCTTSKDGDTKEVCSGDFSQTKLGNTIPSHSSLASWNTSLMNSGYSSVVSSTDVMPIPSNLFHPSSQSSELRPSNNSTASLLPTPSHMNVAVGSMQTFAGPYLNTPAITSCNPMNSYVTSGQFEPNTLNYYQVPARTSQTATATQQSGPQTTQTQPHQLFPARPGYATSVLLDSPSTFHYLPTSVDYSSLMPPLTNAHQTDCASAPYTSVMYHSQPAGCTPITVVPSPGQSNPCFVGPGGESANGAVPFHAQVYSTSSMYPYSPCLGYPHMTTSVPCSQQLNGAVDPRSSVGSETGATGSANYSTRPLTNSYDASEKLSCYPVPSLPGASAVNLSQFGMTPAAQQQLDELVERLAYDNRTEGLLGKSALQAVGSVTPNRTAGQFTPLEHRNSMPSVAPQFSYPNSLSGRTMDNAIASTYPTSMLSTFWASQGASPGSFAATPFSNSQFPNSACVVNAHKQMGDTSVLNGHSSGTVGSTDISNSPNETKPLDQSLTGLDHCGTMKQMLPNVVGIGSTGCEKETSIGSGLGTFSPGDPNARYNLLSPESNAYQPENPSSKPPAVFTNGLPNATVVRAPTEPINALVIPKQVPLMPNLSVLGNTQLGAAGISPPSQPQKVNGSILDSENSSVHGCGPQLPTFDVALSPEDAGSNFSFDGLLAELRLEEKQQNQQEQQQQQTKQQQQQQQQNQQEQQQQQTKQQQQQQQQRSEQAQLLGDECEANLKQNTRMLLDNFSYL